MIKLQDCEIKVMNVIWENGERGMFAREVASKLLDTLEWKPSTTYTLLKRCIKKNAIERIEPAFFCKPIVLKEEVQKYETDELINKIYDGSESLLFSALMQNKGLSSKKIDELLAFIESLEE